MQAHNLPAISPGEGGSIDLRHIWRVVAGNWRSIIGLSVVVSLLAALWVMRIPPVYLATTTILIDTQPANTVSIEEVYALPYRNYQYFQTQVEIIKYRDIAERTADELDLWNHPLFAPPADTGEVEESAVFMAGIRSWISGLLTTTAEKAAPVVDPEEQVDLAFRGDLDLVAPEQSVEEVAFQVKPGDRIQAVRQAAPGSAQSAELVEIFLFQFLAPVIQIFLETHLTGGAIVLVPHFLGDQVVATGRIVLDTLLDKSRIGQLDRVLSLSVLPEPVVRKCIPDHRPPRGVRRRHAGYTQGNPEKTYCQIPHNQ